MITAVLEKRAKLPVGANDIYLSTVGGMRLTDPSSDLAVALAIASAYADLPLPTTAVAIGEVGLAGDLRRVSGMDRGWPRRPGWASPAPWCRPACTAVPAGLRAMPADNITAALRVLHGRSAQTERQYGRSEEGRWP